MECNVTLSLTIPEAESLISRLLASNPDPLLGKQNYHIVINSSQSKRPVDVGVVIALEEEFEVIFPQLKPFPDFVDEISQYFYLFEWECNSGLTASFAATFIGGMGPAKAALVTDRLIALYSPLTVVNLGIAGSLDSDLLVGDVLVGDTADDYMYSSKAVTKNGESAVEFQLAGDPYRSTNSYVKHAENFKFAQTKKNWEWAEGCVELLRSLLRDSDRLGLCSSKAVREVPHLHTGNIASSTIVGASKEFVDWLKKNRNRKYRAIEMEAAGVLLSTTSRSVESLIIRGISDFSDERKSTMDNKYSGALRQYAMSNAIDLLRVLTTSGLIRRRECLVNLETQQNHQVIVNSS